MRPGTSHRNQKSGFEVCQLDSWLWPRNQNLRPEYKTGPQISLTFRSLRIGALTTQKHERQGIPKAIQTQQPTCPQGTNQNGTIFLGKSSFRSTLVRLRHQGLAFQKRLHLRVEFTESQFVFERRAQQHGLGGDQHALYLLWGL